MAKHLVDKDSLELSQMGIELWSGQATEGDSFEAEDISGFFLIMVEISFYSSSNVEVKKNVLCVNDFNEQPAFAGSLLKDDTIYNSLYMVTLWLNGQTNEIDVQTAKRVTNPFESTQTEELVTITKVVGLI